MMAVPGTETTKREAWAALTVTVLDTGAVMPVKGDETAIVCVPAVVNVALKVPKPRLSETPVGRTAPPSLLVKTTGPEKLVSILLN